MKINNSLQNTKFFLVATVFDKPAKAAVLNMKASNGLYGCTKCLQPGVTYKEGESGIYLFFYHLFVFINNSRI